MAEEVGIELYSLASSLYWEYNYTSGDEMKRNKAKEITKKQLEIASLLGCDTILVVPGAVNVFFEQDGEVVEYETITKKYADRSFISDHYPIMSVLKF
jgi:hexulose-6-phosphate isomerase